MKTSADPRHLARKIAVSVEYAISNGSNDREDTIETLISTTTDSLFIDIFDEKLLNLILSTIKENRLDIDKLIKNNCKEWDLDKMYKTDLSILTVAAAELKYLSTPQKVVVDEAVELAKEFGSAESSKFINGVLAGIIVEISKSKNDNGTN